MRQSTQNDLYHVIGHEAADVPVPFEQFVAELQDWGVYPVTARGQVAGVIYHKGAEIHACILPQYRKRWFSRKIVKELLSPILAVHGYLLTTVPDTKPWGHEFVKKFGFKAAGHNGSYTSYQLETMKWV